MPETESHCIRPQTLAKQGFMSQRPALKISVRQHGGTTSLDLAGDITLFNSATGQTSPLYEAGSAAAAANNREIADYLFEASDYKPQTTLLVLDAVVDGKLPWLTLPGGPIAVG